MSKNLGQVSGIHIGATAPNNKILIWYDVSGNNSPEVIGSCHKVYDNGLGSWVILNQKYIKAITKANLVLAAGSQYGLPLGALYKITDLGNYLALSISQKVIQYIDLSGNLIVEDLLAGTKFNHVSSANLTIDGVNGDIITNVNKLNFVLNDVTPGISVNDFVLGKKKVGVNDVLVKYKMSSLRNNNSNNSIVWNNGFFFSFSDSISSMINDMSNAGLINRGTHKTAIQILETRINNIVTEVNNNLTDETVYSKKIPSNVYDIVSGDITDIKKNDALSVIVNKIQNWINKLKYSAGIKLSQAQTFPPTTSDQDLLPTDSIEQAFKKIIYWRKNRKIESVILNELIQPEIFLQKDDTYDTTFQKIQNKFNQIGIIQNGAITSRETVIIGSQPNYVSKIDFKNSFLEFKYKSENFNNFSTILSIDGKTASVKIVGYENGSEVELSKLGIYSKAFSNNLATALELPLNYNCRASISGLVKGEMTGSIDNEKIFMAAVVGNAKNTASVNSAPAYGGWFNKLKVNGFYLSTKISDKLLSPNFYQITDTDSLIVVLDNDLNNTTLFYNLPINPYLGQVINIVNMTAVDSISGIQIKTVNVTTRGSQGEVLRLIIKDNFRDNNFNMDSRRAEIIWTGKLWMMSSIG